MPSADAMDASGGRSARGTCLRSNPSENGSISDPTEVSRTGSPTILAVAAARTAYAMALRSLRSW